jgi:hypothetical protein
MIGFVFADELLPAFDVSDEVAVVVDADPGRVWEELLEVDLLEVGRRAPLAGALGALRALPELVTDLLHGERPAGPPESLRLRELSEVAPAEGGWMLLGERPQESIALGLVGRFWRPVITYAPVTDAEGFRAFDEPGWGKTIYELSVQPLTDGETLLSGLMRTTTTDEHARRWFRRYWALGVGSGAHLLVGSLLELVRERSESEPGG